MPMIYDDDGTECLTIKGRAGMQYETANGDTYEINSEMVASDEYDIAVYASDVVANGGRVVTGSEKDEVISRVIALCEKGRIRIRVF